MIVRAVAQWREPEILAPPWEIVHTVELPPGEFRKFKEDLLQAQPFIMEHANDLYVDNSGLTHGMLVLCEGIDDGILVNSEGFAYARYAAYLSGARTLSLMNRYPSLHDFCVGMDSLVEKYVQQALAGQEDGGFTLFYSDLDAEVEQRVYDEDMVNFDRQLFLDMLSERPEFDEVETTQNEVYLTIAPEFVQEQAPGMSM
ncbi:hypothetical protein D7X94_14845 [Acutalibacter sp. 1XD8-33]|uniref:DUF6329 domain-containing protein n=1 Tax=Acutalibacter sp. 1XD8-33 TaxID=2320081 RepID=UPI000EA08C05|nr:DUF6329 domain-containing protein [Acutalibacter sp. 1XD8-33]RKJ38840.1 hypothetical protein D7X94_14845 [Acutalibacter sp. 1XD8-33]